MFLTVNGVCFHRSHKVGTPVISSLCRSPKKLSFRVASYLEISLYYGCESGGSQIGRPEHCPVDSLSLSLRADSVCERVCSGGLNHLKPDLHSSVDNMLFGYY